MDAAKAVHLPTWLVPIGMLCIIIALRIAAKITGHHMELLRYFPLFAVGMIAYEIQSKDALRKILRKRAVSILALVALVAGMVLFENPYGSGMPLFAFFFTCIACGNSLFGILNARSALVLGEVSFGIYLLHGIVINIVFTEGREIIENLGANQSTVLLLPAAATIVPITAVTYLFVEKTGIKTGKRLAGWWGGRMPRVTAHELDVAP